MNDMKEAVEKVFRFSKGVRRNRAWWWNIEEVYRAIKEERIASSQWRRTKLTEDQGRY